MSLSQTIAIATPPAAVFALYARAEAWPEWDPELRAASLPTGLVPGATGWLQPAKGPRARFTVIEVRPDAGFTVEARLPFCRMVFGHDLTASQTGTLARHWVRFQGPLAFVFRKVIGRDLVAGLPATMAGLKAAAERAPGGTA